MLPNYVILCCDLIFKHFKELHLHSDWMHSNHMDRDWDCQNKKGNFYFLNQSSNVRSVVNYISFCDSTGILWTEEADEKAVEVDSVYKSLNIVLHKL